MSTNQIIHARAWKGNKAYSLCMPAAIDQIIDRKKGRVVGNMAALGTSTPLQKNVTCKACIARMPEPAL